MERRQRDDERAASRQRAEEMVRESERSRADVSHPSGKRRSLCYSSDSSDDEEDYLIKNNKFFHLGAHFDKVTK